MGFVVAAAHFIFMCALKLDATFVCCLCRCNTLEAFLGVPASGMAQELWLLSCHGWYWRGLTLPSTWFDVDVDVA